uniref:Twinstar-like protein n=1 Tax=Parasacculina yatsui TaxID=2836420 RepID=A0A8K1VCG8_9CRUS|nr:twinstar-like protein [Parasacculina yatsui]
MVHTGMKTDDACQQMLVKINKRLKRYCVMHISGDSIVVEKDGDPGTTYEDFLADLTQQDGPRYGLIDMKYDQMKQGVGSTHKEKVVLVMYNPDTGGVKNRMLYSSSFGELKETLNTGHTYQANDMDSLQEQNVIEHISKTDRS